MDSKCSFCSIVAGENKCYRLLETDTCIAFLDKHPINPGHLLVIPKIHEADFYKLDVRVYSELWDIAKDLSLSLEQIFKPKKVGIVIAGFDVPHAHVHIIPMHDYHDITSRAYLEGKKTSPTDEELKTIVNQFNS